MSVEDVLTRHEARLMSIRGVVGIGIGERDGQPVVLVMLDRPAAQLERPIPARLDDVPVEVEVVGEISAF